MVVPNHAIPTTIGIVAVICNDVLFVNLWIAKQYEFVKLAVPKMAISITFDQPSCDESAIVATTKLSYL